MKPSFARTGLLAAVLVFTNPNSVFAATVTQVTLEQLTRASPNVVVARVLQSQSHWQDERLITTDVTVEVVRTLRGNLTAHEQVIVRFAGGIVGSIGQHVPGVVIPSLGSTCVLFLDAPFAPRMFFTSHLTASVMMIDRLQRVHEPVTGIAPGSIAPTNNALDSVAQRVRAVR